MKTDTNTAALVIEDEADDDRAASAAAGNVIVDDDAGEAKKTKLPARAIRNDDGTISLPLLKTVGYTVKSGNGSTRREEVKELVFHDLNGADLRIMAQQSDDMKPVVAFARSTRIPTNRMTVIFDQLGSRDIKAGGDIISFLGE